MKPKRYLPFFLLTPLALTGCSIFKTSSTSTSAFSSSASSSFWSEIPSSDKTTVFDAYERGLKDIAEDDAQALFLTPRSKSEKIVTTDVVSSVAMPGFSASSSSVSSSAASSSYAYTIEATADRVSVFNNGCSTKEDLYSKTLVDSAKITVTSDGGSVSPVQNIAAYYHDHGAYLDLSKAEFTECLIEWLVAKNSSESAWELPPKSYFDLTDEASLIDLAMPLSTTLPSAVSSLRKALEKAYSSGDSGNAVVYEGSDKDYRLVWTMDSPSEAVTFLESETQALFGDSVLGQAAENILNQRIEEFFACVRSFSLLASSYFSPSAFGYTDLSLSFGFDRAALEAQYPDYEVYPDDLDFKGILTPAKGEAAAITDWPQDLDDRTVYPEVDTSVFALPTLPSLP